MKKLLALCLLLPTVAFAAGVAVRWDDVPTLRVPLATNAITAGIVTNGDLSINVDIVPQLQSSLRYSNQLNFVMLGDSIGEYTWRALPRMMGQYSTFTNSQGGFRHGGYTDGWGAWTNNGIVDSVPDTWWAPDTIYTTFSTYDRMLWSVNGLYKINANLLKFWHVGASSNGTVVVETSPDGSSWTTRITQDQSVLARGLHCVNVPLETGDYYVSIKATSGRVQYLFPQMVNTNTRSMFISQMYAGGRAMDSFLLMGTNNIRTLLTNQWPVPTMIVWNDTKPVATYTNWPSIAWCFENFATNADVVLVKPQPSLVPSVEADPANGSFFQALLFNEIARTSNIPFLDVRSTFADTNRSKRLNYYVDAIHLNVNGQDALSEDVWSRLKLPERLVMSQAFRDNTARTNTMVQTSFNVLDGSRNFTVTNAWAALRMGIYFQPPDISSLANANWALAGDGQATGLHWNSSLLFYGPGYTGGGTWFGSGGLGLWGAGYAHSSDDPGIGGLMVAGNLTNYGNSHFSGTTTGNIRPNIGSNSVAVSGNITIYLTNQDGTVYRVAAQRVVP